MPVFVSHLIMSLQQYRLADIFTMLVDVCCCVKHAG